MAIFVPKSGEHCRGGVGWSNCSDARPGFHM